MWFRRNSQNHYRVKTTSVVMVYQMVDLRFRSRVGRHLTSIV